MTIDKLLNCISNYGECFLDWQEDSPDRNCSSRAEAESLGRQLKSMGYNVYYQTYGQGFYGSYPKQPGLPCCIRASVNKLNRTGYIPFN